MNTVCRCGHSVAEHPPEHDEMCFSPGCICAGLWLRAAGVATAPKPPALRDLIRAGKTSKRVHTQRLAKRIEVSIAALILALREERERDIHGRGTRRQLDPETIAARQRTCPDCGHVCANGTGLSSHQRSIHGDASNPVPCPDCGQAVAKQGLGAHRYHAHGVRKAAA